MDNWIQWAGGALAGLIVGKLFNDLVPQRRIFTLFGVLIGIGCVVYVIAAATLARLAMSDNPLTSTLASLVLVIMGCITLTTAGWAYMGRGILKRLDVIEKHVGLSK